MVGKETASGFLTGESNEPQILMVMLTVILAASLIGCWGAIFYKKNLPKALFGPLALMAIAVILTLISGLNR
jgi:hypothetical protein